MCFEMPARVVRREGAEATVDVDGTLRPVSLVVLDLESEPVGPGDWVLVHTGFAVRRLNAPEAAELVALHRELHVLPEEIR
jgi:hydrogenase expression/formation protein HypC